MATPTFEDSAQTAQFIFRGTVEEVGASSVAAVASSDATVVVRVDHVFHEPSALAGHAGQNVTVRLREPGSLRQGDQAVFFTEPLVFGEGLALREVDRHPAEDAPEVLARRVSAARADRADFQMQDHVARADVIVTGRVADVRPAAQARRLTAEPAGRVSEHDAQWTEAVITVDSVVKGEPPTGETVVLFPASQDIAWRRTPKFRPGQEGVFLLHRQESTPELASVPAAEAQPAFTALHSEDVRPPEEAERVRRATGGLHA